MVDLYKWFKFGSIFVSLLIIASVYIKFTSLTESRVDYLSLVSGKARMLEHWSSSMSFYTFPTFSRPNIITMLGCPCFLMDTIQDWNAGMFCLHGWLNNYDFVFRILLIYRSTIVHSNTVPTQEQHSIKDRQTAEAYKRDSEAIHANLSRTTRTPQRIPLGMFTCLHKRRKYLY